MGQTTSSDIDVNDLEIVYTPSILSTADQKDLKEMYKMLEKRRKDYRKHCIKSRGGRMNSITRKGIPVEVQGDNTVMIVKRLLKNQSKR